VHVPITHPIHFLLLLPSVLLLVLLLVVLLWLLLSIDERYRGYPW
jgi:hypothetical protein